MRRVGEGADAQQAIFQVLRRRLVPRGLLPVTRVPRVEQQRWNIFTWVRQYVSLFLEELDTHLRTPLQPVETNRSSSSEDDGREHSRSRSRSRSRPRSPEGSLRSPGDVSLHSDRAINSEGEEVHVPDAEPGTPQRGPPPPDPVQWGPLSRYRASGESRKSRHRNMIRTPLHLPGRGHPQRLQHPQHLQPP